ncbi:MAG: thioredoxin family protein [Treponemataceae bacterium]
MEPQNSKPTCECNGQCKASVNEKSRFIVLGSCCKKSSDTFAHVKIAVKELGLPDEVLNSGDMAEIAQYGVIQTPAFVINNKVVSYGKLISIEEAKQLIQKHLEE